MAEPGTIVASAATRRLVEGLFEWESLGPQSLKGITAPVEVYRVAGSAASKSRFEAAATRGLTPFVGREQELGILLERWERAKDGTGQVVLLGAEPGLGKSRLVHELRERIPAEQRTAIEFQCSPLHRNTALHPVVERLPSLLGFAPEDPPPRKLEVLERQLSASRLRVEEAAPLFASLLSLPTDRYAPLNMSPPLQRERTRETLLAWILAQAERKPLILTFEDLQWVDPATLEFLTLLVDRNPTAPILSVFAFRPEFRPEWEGRSCVTQITLGRFARGEAESIVSRVTGGKELPGEVLAEIVRKTDGVPLFLEELTRMLLESGHLEARNDGYTLKKPITELDIPSTLQGSLMARLDRLGEAKEVAQLGAVIGREFDHELIRTLSPLEESALTRALSTLATAELLYRGALPKARYVFKHALIQDAAYQSLLKRNRRELHRKIADTLKERFSGIAESEPEVIAHHYTEAAEIAEAISWWQHAGERSIGHNAAEEALAHARKGIDLAARLADTGKGALAEARLVGILWHGIGLREGWWSPEAVSLLPRITELSEKLPDGPELAWSLYFRGMIQYPHDCHGGRETLERALEVAERAGQATLVPASHTILGDPLILMGEPELALQHLQEALGTYDPERHRPARSGFPFDLRAEALASSGWALLSLGYPDRAHAACEEAIAHAKAINHPASLALALAVSLTIASFNREPQLVSERARALIDLSREQRLPFYEFGGRIHLGSMAIEEGRVEEGTRLLEEALAAGAGGNPSYANLAAIRLAVAYGMTSRFDQASKLLARAREAVERAGARSFEPLIEGATAMLALFEGNQAEMEDHLRKGLEKSQRQKSKLLELMFAIGLARLYAAQGKKEEGRHLLKEVYDWFTEGFDTRHLKEARALLDELGRT